jgi:hypothetical protein
VVKGGERKREKAEGREIFMGAAWRSVCIKMPVAPSLIALNDPEDT